MSMVTRCPSCATLFRVTPQQLQARHGQVRCGRCALVFDGFKGLATLPEQIAPAPVVRAAATPVAAAVGSRDGLGAPSELAEQSPEAALLGDAAPHTAQAPAPLFMSAPAGTVAAAAADVPVEVAALEPVPLPQYSTPARAADHAGALREGPQREPPPVGSQSERPTTPEPVRPRASRWWSVCSALLLLTLAGQATYAYRAELIASYPGAKPFVAQFCGFIGCAVPLPQRPQLVHIEASDIQVQDPARPSLIQLTATLRNHAGYEVGYPALDLVLTNTKEHTLARRIVMPEDYLGKERSAAAGLPANAEITVQLAFDTGDLGPAGFRLALLPAR